MFIVWVAVAVFPHASVAVHVLTIVYAPSHAPGVVTSAKVNVTSPVQLSLAVGVANSGTAGQSIVDVSGSVEITGAKVSPT